VREFYKLGDSDSFDSISCSEVVVLEEFPKLVEYSSEFELEVESDSSLQEL
jgi:hypothetical protein